MAKKQAPRLLDFHRAFLVRELACFATPKEAAEALNESHGVTVTPQAVERYDPGKRAGARMAKKWVELFEQCREAFLEHVEKSVPEAHKAVRIRQLAMASRYYKTRSNFMAMADMFERIAKEMGNVHTNRRELTGKDSGPIKYQDVSAMTDDQIAAELQALIGRRAFVHKTPEMEQ